MARIHLRKSYTLGGLRRRDLVADPIRQFDRWFRAALRRQKDEAYAMTLATADRRGRPSSRTVLLRAYDRRGFAFYTNYRSRKARELLENPRAALTFHWPALQRQVCVTGSVTRTSRPDSAAYFRTRPAGHQLAAWVSHQSEVIPSRETLEAGLAAMQRRFLGRAVPLPPAWGGYRVKPDTIEFWQGRPNRLHDRFRYSRRRNGKWSLDRLAP